MVGMLVPRVILFFGYHKRKELIVSAGDNTKLQIGFGFESD